MPTVLMYVSWNLLRTYLLTNEVLPIPESPIISNLIFFSSFWKLLPMLLPLSFDFILNDKFISIGRIKSIALNKIQHHFCLLVDKHWSTMLSIHS
jgi:hypothetical protein